MKPDNFLLIISSLLIVLFVYTGLSKLIDFENFRGQMLNQPLPTAITRHLSWFVPMAELITAALLIMKPFRKLGFAISLGLMTVFTLYVALVIANAFDRVPCSCGGIMESLSWEAHLGVNIFFWLLSLCGLVPEMKILENKNRYRDSPAHTSQAGKGAS